MATIYFSSFHEDSNGHPVKEDRKFSEQAFREHMKNLFFFRQGDTIAQAEQSAQRLSLTGQLRLLAFGKTMTVRWAKDCPVV